MFIIPKFTALAVRKAAEIGWPPFHLLNNVSSSVGSSLRSAGFHNVLGTVSTAYFKQPGDPVWANDPAYRDWQPSWTTTSWVSGRVPAARRYMGILPLKRSLKS